jgi:hypothetical protein
MSGLFFYFFFCPADLIRSSSFRNSAVSSSGLLEGRFWKGITSDMGRTSLGATTALCGSFCRQILHFLRHMFAPSGSKSAMSGVSCLDPANYLIWRYFVRRMAVPLDGTPGAAPSLARRFRQKCEPAIKRAIWRFDSACSLMMTWPRSAACRSHPAMKRADF